MNFTLFKVFIISICINVILFNNIKAEKHIKRFFIVPTEQTSIKSIIFDLGDVLVTSSHTQQLMACCISALQHPSLFYTFMTKNIRQELFATLHSVPANSCNKTEIMYNQGKKMPQIMVDWLIGRSNIEVLAATLACISKDDSSPAQKAMFCKIVQKIFDPKLFVECIQIVEPMAKLANDLKNKNQLNIMTAKIMVINYIYYLTGTQNHFLYC